MSRRVVSFAWLAFAWFSIGCASDKTQPVTEVLVEIDADPQVRVIADTLRVAIASGPEGASKLERSGDESFMLTADGFHWPASIALVAKAGHLDHSFELTISAEQDGNPIAMSRVRSGFVREKTLVLRTTLFDACIGRFDCKSDETCTDDSTGGAQCVSALIDPKTLEVFDRSEVRDAGSTPARDAGRADAGADHDAGMHAMDAGMDAGGGAAGSDAALQDSGATEAGAANDAGEKDAGKKDAGTPRDSGSPPACVASGAEDCWNGVDDDCNGDTDCADDACKPIAVCAPAGPVVGVLVPDSDACPSQFQHSQMLLHQGLMDGGCVGCSCSSGTTACYPHIYFYSAQATCTADTAQTAGTLVATPTSSCSSMPIGEMQSIETPVAWRVATDMVAGGCTSSGAPSAVPASWTTSMKLCTTTQLGAGCDTGEVCMPKPSASARVCSQKSGSCLASAPGQRYYRGYSDSRGCDACTCNATGSSCDNVYVELGHDWTCPSTPDDRLRGGQQHCSLSTYAPPAYVTGTPTNPTCSASSATTGTLAATGALDLCCMP